MIIQLDHAGVAYLVDVAQSVGFEVKAISSYVADDQMPEIDLRFVQTRIAMPTPSMTEEEVEKKISDELGKLKAQSEDAYAKKFQTL